MLLVVIHPDLCGTSRIPGEDIPAAAGKSVRMSFAENVTHTTAGNDFQTSAALPHPEGYLQILAAPNIHFHVVLAQLVEVGLVDDEQSAGNHGRPDGGRGVVVPHCPLRRTQVLPLEDQIPVETASQVSGGSDVLEVVHADHIDDGADHAGRILADSFQQGLQPPLVALHVAVQEGQHTADGGICTPDPGPN